MFNRYFVFISFVPLLAGMAWLSGQVESSIRPEGEQGGLVWRQDQARKRELLQFLDRAVSLQHYFRSVNGRFATKLSQLEVAVPAELKENYDFEIQTSPDRNHEHFRLVASSRRDTQRVAVDDEFQVKANFKIPGPSAEYVRSRATEYLEALNAAPAGQIPTEQGIYRDYFQFQDGGAIGVRPPVVGMRIDAPRSRSKKGVPWRLPEPVLEASADDNPGIAARLQKSAGRSPASVNEGVGSLEIEPVLPEE